MTRKVKILVADDAPEVANRLAQMLSELDEVDVVGPAANGREALELYRQHKPLAAVLDLRMPGLNGLQLLETIRAKDHSILLIILTNECSEEFRQRCLQAGANHYLEKSEDFDQTVDIIRNFIQQPG